MSGTIHVFDGLLEVDYHQWLTVPMTRSRALAGCVVAVVVVSGLAPGRAASAVDASAKLTVAACIQAWNRAPATLRTSTSRRHLADTPTQIIAGTVGGSPACGILFRAAGGNSAILVTGRWEAGKVSAWATSAVRGSLITKAITPDDVGQVVFGPTGRLRHPDPLPPSPTPAECVRDWNRRPSTPRLILARRHPQGIHVTVGVVTSVRDGVLRTSSQPACRMVFALNGDAFALVFGVWGTHHRVTAWKPPQTNGVSPDEIAAITHGGLSNATIRGDGTLHLFR
jgi:hypothetical protein